MTNSPMDALRLQPRVSASRLMRRVTPFGHDSLEPEPARFGEHLFALAGDMFE